MPLRRATQRSLVCAKMTEVKNKRPSCQTLTTDLKVELLEKKKAKTSLTGEHDMDMFDFLNLPLKDLVTEDVSMLKLSIPNITSLTPFYSDGKKEDHLYCSIIPIHNRQNVILYQNERERRMHKINSVFTETIEVYLEALSTQKNRKTRIPCRCDLC